MLKSFATYQNRKRSLIFLSGCVIFAIVATIIGISDNTPGISFAFLSAISFILTFVHHWRTSKQFLYFLLASVLGIIVFVVLHNVFEAIGMKTGSGFWSDLSNGIGAVFFLLAILVCPPGILVGIVGAVAMAFRKKSTPSDELKGKVKCQT